MMMSFLPTQLYSLITPHTLCATHLLDKPCILPSPKCHSHHNLFFFFFWSLKDSRSHSIVQYSLCSWQYFEQCFNCVVELTVGFLCIQELSSNYQYSQSPSSNIIQIFKYRNRLLYNIKVQVFFFLFLKKTQFKSHLPCYSIINLLSIAQLLNSLNRDSL